MLIGPTPGLFGARHCPVPTPSPWPSSRHGSKAACHHLCRLLLAPLRAFGLDIPEPLPLLLMDFVNYSGLQTKETHTYAHTQTHTHQTFPTGSSRKVPVRHGQEREGGLPGWFPTSIMKFGPGQSCSLKGRVFGSVSFFLFYLLSLTGSTRPVVPAHAWSPRLTFPSPTPPQMLRLCGGQGAGRGAHLFFAFSQLNGCNFCMMSLILRVQSTCISIFFHQSVNSYDPPKD